MRWSFSWSIFKDMIWLNWHLKANGTRKQGAAGGLQGIQGVGGELRLQPFDAPIVASVAVCSGDAGGAQVAQSGPPSPATLSSSRRGSRSEHTHCTNRTFCASYYTGRQPKPSSCSCLRQCVCVCMYELVEEVVRALSPIWHGAAWFGILCERVPCVVLFAQHRNSTSGQATRMQITTLHTYSLTYYSKASKSAERYPHCSIDTVPTFGWHSSWDNMDPYTGFSTSSHSRGTLNELFLTWNEPNVMGIAFYNTLVGQIQ